MPYTIYVPHTQLPYWLELGSWPSMALVTRVEGPPADANRAIGEAIRELDATLASDAVTSLLELMRNSRARERLLALLLGTFSVIAQGLALLGVYGVIAHAVRQRRREIALRMALGADRGRVVRRVVGNGLRLAVLGAGIGLALAWYMTRFLRDALYGIEPVDPATYAAVTAIVLAAAAAAAYLPAFGAARLEPMAVLRED